ncbi:MAG: GHKL domain-containing protein [Cytophagales bacterium]|nr:GHKL domain-containing protein [Cytophagales bacterium]
MKTYLSRKIKSVINILLGILFTLQVSGQDIQNDSLFIRTFGTADYRASLINYSVTEDDNGIMYFANENGILEYDGSIWKLYSSPDFSYVVSIEAGPDGRIYIGGFNEFGYLNRDEIGKLKYTSLRGLIETEKELNEIWQIVFYEGDVLFQSYEGLTRYNGETTSFLPMECSWFLPIGDEMYIHSWDKGLSRLEDDTSILVNTDLIFNDTDNEQNAFKTLKGFGSEKLLFTEYSGVYLLDTVTFKSRKWNIPAHDQIVKDGLYDVMQWNDSLYLLTTIRNGLIWMNDKGEIVKTLSKKDGLDALAYGNAHRDSRGNVWLPAEGIYHIIWPEKQKLDEFSILIRSITIADSVISINSNQGFFKSELYAPLTSISFNFSSPGFDKTDLQYSYKLEGLNQDWSGWTDNINKSYTNLDGGTYTFRVKARIVNGKEAKPASLELIIPTLWYRTGWAFAGGSFTVCLFVVAAFRYRTTRHKTHNKVLEELVRERTKEIRDKNDALREKNTELDNFVLRVSHDLIAPLRSIKGLVNIIRLEKTKKGRDECFDLMESSIDKQEDFIKGILEHSVNYNQDIKYADIVVKDVCSEIIKELTYYQGAQSINIRCDLEDDFTFNNDPDRVKIVLSNLINNAIKYHNYDQPEPEIVVTAENESDRTIIKVSDNGLGIDKDKLPEIFNMFFRASVTAEGTGLGLFIVKNAMKKMNGTISVSSEEGKGSVFTLVFNK